MAKEKKITERMELGEAIAISRTYSLETLLGNFLPDKSLLVRRGAEEALAVCPDPRTMPRLLELLNEELSEPGEEPCSRWFSPIELRLRTQSLPKREIQMAIAALLPLIDYQVHKDDLEPVPARALGALSEAQPLPPEIVKRCSKKLDHPNYSVASAALRVLINLPPEKRGPWVPLLVKQFHRRFTEHSEAVWIIESLGAHLTSHRKLVAPVLRDALKRGGDSFLPGSVLDVLRQLGPAAGELVPDVLEYIGRQKAYTNQEPHLIHMDPNGTAAIPGLIELLGHTKSTVRYQAAGELEAYGTRAASAVAKLTKLAKGRDQLVAVAAQRALLAIEVQQAGGSVPEKLSATERLFGVLDDVIQEGPDPKRRPKRKK
jgi:hypothetical protein